MSRWLKRQAASLNCGQTTWDHVPNKEELSVEFQEDSCEPVASPWNYLYQKDDL